VNVADRIKCWGGNQYGQLGQGDNRSRGHRPNTMGLSLPTIDLGRDARLKKLSLGPGHACALLQSNALKCWGSNDYGQAAVAIEEGEANPRHRQIGDEPTEMGDDLRSIELGSVSQPQDVVADGETTCVLQGTGTLRCWGRLLSDDSSTWGFKSAWLGNGPPTLAVSAPGQITGLFPGCFRLNEGSFVCWKTGVRNSLIAKERVLSVGAAMPVEVRVGWEARCARYTDGTVRCWGTADSGQLGYPVTPDSRGQVRVASPPKQGVALGRNRRATRIALSSYHTCALLDDSTLKCWGSNEDGALGCLHNQDDDCTTYDGKHFPCRRIPPETPIDLKSHCRPVEVAAGAGFTCVLFDDATVKCRGTNTIGELGYEDTKNRDVPPEEVVPY
jgi:alpha-tubulin suppressor-like RCC1 family protein